MQLNDSIIDKSEKTKDKTIRLVEYLAALARINARIIWSVDEYQKVIWKHDIPREPRYCFARVWDEEDERGDDVWIEVKKFPEPQLPKVPDTCLDWADQETLRNTRDLPELYESITVEREEQDAGTGEKFMVGETLSLPDHPEVQKAWNDYLEKYWLPWAELYGRYSSVQKVYADLFRIYQEQQKLGEQYELVFCLGLLTWRTSSGHDVKRHLVVAKASLVFEPHLGKFTVGPATDGDQVDVELDMLDMEDQPENARKLVEDGRATLRNNFWDRSAVDPLLAAIANSLADSGQGEYHKDSLEPRRESPSAKPVVEYAPALILRKRSMRGLEQLLAKIKEQMEAGGRMPHEFLDLCESLDAVEKHEADGTEGGRASEEVEVYFPLPANDEQRRIIRTLDRQRGVLVQGPPGTGKSHTIANLICHLLATGRRVLVTAKTPRALKVLHNKLPGEIKPLCINLLGSGTDEKESLEKSVVSILTRLDRWDKTSAGQRICQLEGQIQTNRKARAEADGGLMALRESETFKHTVADGAYSGTAAGIARRLKDEEENYFWFVDHIAPGAALPLSQEEIQCLCRDIVDFDAEAEKQLSLFIPDPDFDLPHGDSVRALFLQEQAAQQKVAATAEILHSPEGRAILSAGKVQIEQLTQSLGELAAATEDNLKKPAPWAPQAVHDVLTDKVMLWKELLKLSTEQAEGIRDVAARVDAFDIVILKDMDRKKLLHDAKALKVHFEAGGGKGFWIFKPKVMKEHGTLLTLVKVDGFYCANAQALEKLIDYLAVEQRLAYIWSMWSGKTDRHDGPFPLQVAEIEELNEALKSIVMLYDLREKAIDCAKNVPGLSSPRWDEVASLYKLMEACRAVLVQLEFLEIEKEIEKMEGRLSALATRDDAHPITGEIAQAFRKRDIDLFFRLVGRAQDLHRKAISLHKKRQTIGSLAKEAPQLAGILACCRGPHEWSKRLGNLDKAWAWARAKSWLEEFLDTDSESLERHSRNLDGEIRKDLAELASLKAWRFCFSRMQEEHRRNLIGWQQAMKRGGKFTGKHAHIHRRDAQRHLNECRDAVPAWIMPLHRVYETVKAGAGIFDVIIVDEASQCGPEALPLLYLGKRIVVVGDDKQISPEAVGVKRDHVQRLMRNYLHDFKYADSFDVENSLFDHGRLRFSNRIALREHFRCMPEIIHFSNDLCYRTDPLIPLRQYPPDRLEPVKAVYIRDGYREGDGPRVINRPEAEALVEIVVSCCQKERYQGMTMGVITLQGEAQAYLIEDMLLKRLGAEEMEKRRLICGNPYSFQGDERGVIFLSMVAAPNERIGVLTQEADRRRFNVATSRGKDQMWLFHSVTTNHLSVHCFRRRLLDYCYNPLSRITQAIGEGADELREKAFRANRLIEKPPRPFESWFEVDVCLAIAGRGYRVVPQFEFAGKRIDLVVQGAKAQIAVECYGDFWHGTDEYVADMERQRKLERCGWHFFPPVRECCYYANPEKTLEPLWAFLERMGILPVSVDVEVDVEIETNGQEELWHNVEEDEEEHDDAEDYPEENGADDCEDPEQEQEIDQVYETASHEKEGAVPQNIHEALRVKPDFLIRAIIDILRARPNFSCVREKMPVYILKHWNIRTRGLPREQFAKKVDDLVAVMARKGYLTIYRSKNVRIKLGVGMFYRIKSL